MVLKKAGNGHAATTPKALELFLKEGDGWLASEFEQLIDGERQHTEHQKRHDLAGSEHANGTRTELIFEPAVGTFNHGAQRKALFLCGRERQSLAHPNISKSSIRILCGIINVRTYTDKFV